MCAWVMISLMNVVFRRARREDVPPIVALLADDELGEAREQVDGDVEVSYLAAFDAIEADARQFLAVADLDGAVVGTLQISYIPSLTLRGGERAQI